MASNVNYLLDGLVKYGSRVLFSFSSMSVILDTGQLPHEALPAWLFCLPDCALLEDAAGQAVIPAETSYVFRRHLMTRHPPATSPRRKDYKTLQRARCSHSNPGEPESFRDAEH